MMTKDEKLELINKLSTLQLENKEFRYLRSLIVANVNCNQTCLDYYNNNKEQLIKKQLNYYHTVVKNDPEKLARKKAYNKEYAKRKAQENKLKKQRKDK